MLNRVPCYIDEATQTRIEFHMVKHTPGFTHRVIINGKAVDWLSDMSKPSRRSAIYFLKKHSKA